jgi:hypothetical protein
VSDKWCIHDENNLRIIVITRKGMNKKKRGEKIRGKMTRTDKFQDLLFSVVF